ncbi:MAG: NAD(P)-dependent oxidoreductase [Phycisphaerales bacterium]
MDEARAMVLVAEPIPAEAVRWLGERVEVVASAPGEANFAESLARASGLVVRTYTRVDAALLAAAPHLRVVGRAGVGVDNIDLAACAARGVRVVHTPLANADAVVELVLGLVLDVLRPRPLVDRAMSPQEWGALRESLIAPRQLAGSTLGVYGFGRVGSRLGRVGVALGMRVLSHDVREIPEAERHGATPVDVETLLAESDVVSVHVDERGSNRGLIGPDAFARLRRDVVFVNTSRGFVVDAGSCAEFLRENPGATAILDVHEPEPIEAGSPLLGLANARLTPHIGAATARAKEAMGWVVRDVWRVIEGETPEFEARPASA